jgi:AraC-like DNA-binding protein
MNKEATETGKMGFPVSSCGRADHGLLPANDGQPMEITHKLSDTFDHLPHGGVKPDPLSEILECLSLRSWIPGQFELRSPWGIRFPSGLGWFCLVTGSPCLVEARGLHSPVSVTDGDLIVVVQGREHQLRDNLDSPITPVEHLLQPRHFENREPLTCDGGGALTTLFCGCFQFDDLERSPVNEVLPPLIHVRGRRGEPQPYVDYLIRLISQEAAFQEPCMQTVINRLVRILFVKAVNGCMPAVSDNGGNWLSALADPDIGRALGLMHAQPEAPWTAASLADRVAMSRSAFCAHFTQLVGKPPLEYLTEWRMQKACFLLRTTRAELKEVAMRVGYESAAAFSKAFTRWAGSAPGAYRHGTSTSRLPGAATMPPL